MIASTSPADSSEIVSVATAHLDRFDTVLRSRNTVQRENHLALTVNGEVQAPLICSATQLPELVLGRLFTNHLIESAEDVESLSINEQAMEAHVTIRQSAPARCLDSESIQNPKAWSPARIFALAEEFEADRTSHRRTRGVHSVYLALLDKGEDATEATETGLLVCCEDIGRHNAFDKAIGWALLNRIDLGQCMLFTSGRVPQEIAEKAIRARIPVLVSKAAVTDRAIELAIASRLTLIALASSRSLDIMNDAVGALIQEQPA